MLLTVARIVKANRYKGHDVVLKALARMVQTVRNVAYVIVGTGDDMEYLVALARQFGVRKKVVFAGSVPDAIRDGITGFLLNPNDAEELAGKILLVLQEPGLAAELVRNGRQSIENEMNWDRGARELSAALDRFFPAVS